jgi:hypothetical protein
MAKSSKLDIGLNGLLAVEDKGVEKRIKVQGHNIKFSEPQQVSDDQSIANHV